MEKFTPPNCFIPGVRSDDIWEFTLTMSASLSGQITPEMKVKNHLASGFEGLPAICR